MDIVVFMLPLTLEETKGLEKVKLMRKKRGREHLLFWCYNVSEVDKVKAHTYETYEKNPTLNFDPKLKKIRLFSHSKKRDGVKVFI